MDAVFYIGVKGVIRRPNGDVLIIHPLSTPDGHDCWDLPGGRIKENETPHEALSREAQEEIGLSQLTVKRHLGMAPSKIRKKVAGTSRSAEIIFSLYECSTTLSDISPPPGMTLHWCTPEVATRQTTA
jgi:ADP-ribose pyrophosphatase YjhB (NUDIX family)